MSTGTLGFKDFLCNNRLGITATREHVIGDMNDWIAENNVRVINVETIFGNDLRSSGHMALIEGFRGVRLWYMLTPVTKVVPIRSSRA